MNSNAETLQYNSITLYKACIMFNAVEEQDPIALECLDVDALIVKNLTFENAIGKIHSKEKVALTCKE